MSPKLRGKGRRWGRRVRTWAAPVVFTVALAPMACSKDKKVDEERTMNPPAPDDRDDTTPDPKDPVTPDGDKPVVAVDAGAPPKVAGPVNLGRLFRIDEDGPCKFAEESGCEPTEKCNPPPPREVDCGPLPNADGMSGDVMRAADGTCQWHQDTQCPPNVPCNPPAPMDLPCPE